MLLLNNSGAGAGTPVALRSNMREQNQLYTLYTWGTFGGAAVTIEISPNESGNASTDWFAIPGVSITTQDVQNIEFRAARVRAVVTGGAGQAINCALR